MRVLVATDSFKGSLSSVEAGRAMEKGICRSLQDAQVTVMPVSDGGEGMLVAFAEAAESSLVPIHAHDARMRIVPTHYVLSTDGLTTYVEMAHSSGLSHVGENISSAACTCLTDWIKGGNQKLKDGKRGDRNKKEIYLK